MLRKSLRFTFRPGVLSAVAALLLLPCARADVKLPGLFSHNMVLQQGMPVPVWGWADEGEQVTVQFQNQRLTTKAKDGRWQVALKPLSAGGPESLTISGKNRVRLDNVLIGEVWICSGQSNMEWPLNKSFEAKADIDKSANAEIRLFTVQKDKQQDALADLRQPWNVGKFAWQLCDKQTTPDFSAVAYYFGRELQKTRGVPVGLIHTSWGGSPAEVWMSREVLLANPAYYRDIVEKGEADWKKYEEAKAKYDKDAAAAKKAGGQAAGQAPRAPWRPSELYNGMISPLIPFAIKGAIWYQGESNAGRAHQYRTLFPDMIKNWRKDWKQPDFPFLFVQLAPFKAIKTEPGDSDWAELRDSQFHTLRTLPKTGMAVITDLGDEKDIHPTKKQPVGERLATAARVVAYGERIVGAGPLFKAMKVKSDKTLGDRAILTFDNVGGGLEARGGELKGFSVCGDDRKFVWAKAEILPDNTIAVSHPDVKKPVAVRFGWADYPVVNLWNKDGLPASPFRTDDFPMITAPK
jgi:sialate O-acetylesterase